MVGRHCILEGRVQGVGFRYFTQRVARQLGVNGWVRNLPDGTVEVHAEGDGESVDRFLDRVKEGPSYGRVTSSSVDSVEVEGFDSFDIRM